MSTSIEKVETGSSLASLTGLESSLAKASVFGGRWTTTSGRERARSREAGNERRLRSHRDGPSQAGALNRASLRVLARSIATSVRSDSPETANGASGPGRATAGSSLCARGSATATSSGDLGGASVDRSDARTGGSPVEGPGDAHSRSFSSPSASATTTSGCDVASRSRNTKRTANPTAATQAATATAGREVTAANRSRASRPKAAQAPRRPSMRCDSVVESSARSNDSIARASVAFRLSASGSGVASSNARFRSSSGSVIVLFPPATWPAAVCGPPTAANSRCPRRFRALLRRHGGSSRHRPSARPCRADHPAAQTWPLGANRDRRPCLSPSPGDSLPSLPNPPPPSSGWSHAAAVVHRVHRNPVQPRRDSRLPPEALQLPRQRKTDVLRQILRLLPPSGQPKAEPEDPVVVKVEKLGERFTVSFRSSLRQLALCLWHASHTRATPGGTPSGTCDRLHRVCHPHSSV